MPNIQHVVLTDVDTHEPKHITSAVNASDAGKVIVAKGDGTSELRKLKFTDIDTSSNSGGVFPNNLWLGNPSTGTTHRSVGISSTITILGAGKYRFTFLSAKSNATYGVIATCKGGYLNWVSTANHTTTSFEVLVGYHYDNDSLPITVHVSGLCIIVFDDV